MKQVLLLTTICLSILSVNSFAQPNVFDPADPIVTYNSNTPPTTSWGNIQKWVVTNRNLGWTTSSYKAYHFNGISFRVKFPKTYQHNVNDGKKYPVMIFWHGAGEKGSIYDNELQLLHGGRTFRDHVDAGNFDGFLVYPQNTGGYFGNTYYAPMWQVIDSMAKYVKLDVDRVLVNGLSAGGSASFDVTAGYPHRVTKATPSAAAATGLIPYIPSFIHVPIWFATGGKDTNPSPFMSKMLYDSLKNRGADITWTEYANLGHFVWNNHWMEPNFIPYMNDMHKANPLVYFQRNLFCPDSPTNARLGISAGFYAYEWQVDSGLGYSNIAAATSNEYIATAYGNYRVRFKRTATSDWSLWSPKPVSVGPKTTTVTPAITVKGMRSRVLPAPDGSTTVPLRLPPGYFGYEYWKTGVDTAVGKDSIYNASPGTYRARVKEQFGCNAFFSPNFIVVNADGINKPDPAKNLTAFPLSQTSIQLDWSDNPNPAYQETGFEIYRATQSGGPYTLIAITGPNALTYQDLNLKVNQLYYYILRAVNDNAAAAVSNETSAKTIADNNPPTAPGNLRTVVAGRFSVTLQWDPSTDDAGVSHYDIFMNGAKLFTTQQTIFAVNELDSFKRYTFQVKAKDISGNYSAPSNQINVTTKNQGLFYQYYHGNWTALPDFDNTFPVEKYGVSATADISVRTRNDNFAFIWRGYIVVPTTAQYTFETCSDDGSKMYVNMPYDHTATPTVANDFTHGNTCRTGNINLVAGVSYPVTITFFEATGGESMQVYWRNNAGLARTLIPASAFSDNFTPSGSAPTAPSGLNAVAGGYDRINLSWTDNSNNETGFEIRRATASGGPFVNIATTNAGVNSFVDSGRNASTTYWYNIRAIGADGESAYTSNANATTQPAPPAPSAPTLLTAEVISSTQINLSWNDNSNNETAFEIYRSTNDNTNFRFITTVTGGAGASKTYSDQGLFANVRYYYKVRAAGPVGNSAYTNEVNGKTLNTVPELTEILAFTVRHSVETKIEMNASDVDGDALTFSSPDMPEFVTIEPGSNGTANLVFNPGFGDQGGYIMTFIVSDGNGGEDITYLTFQVNENALPTLDPIAPIVVDEGGTLTVNLNADDAENPAFIGWGFTGLPGFASFSDNNMGQGTLELNPGYADAGVYNVSLMIDDGFGAWIMRHFTITINEKDPNEKILVSIRNATLSPEPWNNMSSQSILNMKNTDGEVTTVDAAVANSWQFNLNNLGAQTGNDSGVYPDAVMRDAIHWGYFFGGNAIDTSTLTISGLNPARRYTLVFFGSSVYNLYPDNGTTKYRVGAQTVSLAVQNNTKKKVAIHDISPTAGGTITVQMIGDPHPDLGGWLNAFEIINQYDDGTLPARPTDLTATFVEHKGTVLNWNDVAYNETRYKVYRATSAAGPFTLLNPDGQNANEETYSDSTAVPATQYYYYITGSNSVGDSEPSDTVTVTTGNNSPLINNLENLFVKTGNTASEPFTITDNAGDIVSVSTEDMPPFVTLESLGGTNYQLVANPGIQYIGVFTMKVVATDNKGGTNSRTVSVQVADKRTRSFYVKFGVEANTAGYPWNDFLGSTYASKQLLNLKDEAGTSTGYSIRVDSSWSNTFELGYLTGNNSGVFSDSVLRSGVLSDHATQRRFTFIGLDPTKKYNVAFIGSSNNGVTASADYSATGATTTSLNARYNQHRLAYLVGLTPTGGNNSIQVNITKQAGVQLMYLNGIVLEEYTDTVTLMNPIHLFAKPTGKNSIVLYWADRTNNENGYEVYRATAENGPWTLVTTTAANVTTYTNTGLTSNTKYWYRVRAKRNTGPVYSDYSNSDAAITLKSIVYVNLTFTYPAAAPWNNTNVNPEPGLSFPDLKNDISQSTGITMSIVSQFNGQNDMGMQSGGAGVFPDAVMRSCYWLDRTQLGQFKLTGLNHSKRYRIGFFGSIGPGWDGNFVSTYTVNGKTVYLNSFRNDTEVAYIGDLQPDENGELMLDVSTISNANYGFTTAIVIQSYDDTAGGTNTNQPEGGGTIESGREYIVGTSANVAQESQVTGETKQTHLQIYPNPFTDNVKIDFFNTAGGSQVTVDIHDVTGRLVYRRDAGRVPAGMNTLRLDVGNSSLSQGVYVVRLNINGKVVSTARLVKAKK